MVDLGTFVDDRVLDLDEVADMDVFGQFCARAEARERPDDGTAADMAAFEMAEGADARAGFDGHAGTDDDMGFDHRVAADDGVMGKEDGLGRDEGDAIFDRCRTGAGLEQ